MLSQKNALEWEDVVQYMIRIVQTLRQEWKNEKKKGMSYEQEIFHLYWRCRHQKKWV
jgi:isochorismate synthase EntC